MKPIAKVFLVIGTLLFALLIWSLVFQDGGVLRTAWNGLVTPINTAYQQITASPDVLIPVWGTSDDMEAEGMDFEDGLAW